MELIDKSAVKAEIERMLQNEYPCDNSEQGTGYDCALYELQDFLDTLEVDEEPVSNDLEEAAKIYTVSLVINEIIPDATVKQLKEVADKAFKAGAQWQKEQMIDKACEWLENLFAPDGSIIPENIKRIEDFKNYMK